MSTIYIKKDTKRELTKIMGELQAKLGKKLDFDKTIRYLIKIYRTKEKRRDLFEKFTEPIKDVKFEEVYRELMKERRIDERSI